MEIALDSSAAFRSGDHGQLHREDRQADAGDVAQQDARRRSSIGVQGFFPDNAVEYFVSYFDYYQPEAYIPRTDTYIEKDSVDQRGDRAAAVSARWGRC